jgi:bis(5'-nucleosyl)-tetraphosphatase (symmetrical)
MATYAIGDIQGCLQPLRQLLELVGFSARRDHIWLVGDLVNRGPQSLETLRFVRDLGDSVITVLGNHDLHLITLAAGFGRPRADDTLDAILAAEDRVSLLEWLCSRKLFHAEDDYAMVHAGLLPQWPISQALELAAEVEQTLQGEQHVEFARNMYGSEPDRWDNQLQGWDRLRVIVNAMTRMRVCDPSGRMEFRFKGTRQDIPPGYLPWFDVRGRQSANTTIVCGHWSALGLHMKSNLLALDGGCLWGRELCAVRLEDRQVFRINCRESAAGARQQY